MKDLTEKIKRISIFNAKGGVGKTAIAANLALMYDDYGIVTNDKMSVLSEIFDKRLLVLSSEQNLPTLPAFKPETPLIFDFGGFPDKRALRVIKESDVVLTPVLPYFENMRITLDLIYELREINRNIIVIVNNTIGNDYDKIKKTISPHFVDLTILELKRSAVFRRVIEEKKSIAELTVIHKPYRRFFEPVAEQFRTICQHIRSYND